MKYNVPWFIDFLSLFLEKLILYDLSEYQVRMSRNASMPHSPGYMAPIPVSLSVYKCFPISVSIRDFVSP